MKFDIIAITVKPQNGTIILCTYVGSVFLTASLWLGNYMGNPKVLEVYSFCSWTLYQYPFTVSVAVIVIKIRKALYRANRENIDIVTILLKYRTGLVHMLISHHLNICLYH